jgi:hypothetical protein
MTKAGRAGCLAQAALTLLVIAFSFVASGAMLALLLIHPTTHKQWLVLHAEMSFLEKTRIIVLTVTTFALLARICVIAVNPERRRR